MATFASASSRPRRWLTAAALAAGLGACASVELGAPFDPLTFESNVQRGVTTRTQVLAWLGSPSGKGVAVDSAGQRFEEWTYYHGAGRLPGLSDARFRILQVRFDAQGIVRAYNWSAKP